MEELLDYAMERLENPNLKNMIEEYIRQNGIDINERMSIDNLSTDSGEVLGPYLPPTNILFHVHNLQLFKILVEIGADYNSVCEGDRRGDTDGNTVLMEQSQFETSDIVNYLVNELNVDINVQNANGETALQIASDINQILILRSGRVDFNLVDRFRNTQLKIKYQARRIISKLYLDNILEIARNNRELGQLFLRDCIYFKYKILVDDLLEIGILPTREDFKAVLIYGAKISQKFARRVPDNIIDECFSTIFGRQIRDYYVSTAKILLERGVDQYAKDVALRHMTVQAQNAHNDAMTKMLLEYGAIPPQGTVNTVVNVWLRAIAKREVDPYLGEDISGIVGGYFAFEKKVNETGLKYENKYIKQLKDAIRKARGIDESDPQYLEKVHKAGFDVNLKNKAREYKEKVKETLEKVSKLIRKNEKKNEK